MKMSPNPLLLSLLLSTGLAVGCSGSGQAPVRDGTDAASDGERSAAGTNGTSDAGPAAAADSSDAARATGNKTTLPKEDAQLVELKQVCKTGERDGKELGYGEDEKVCREVADLMGQNMASANCGAIEKYWEQSIDVNSDIKPMLHGAYGLRAAQCDRWDIVFEDLMHWGNGAGPELLAKLDEAGVPVEERFVTYLQETEKPLDIKHSAFAIMNFLYWKNQKGGGEPCGTFVPFVEKLNATAAYRLIAEFNRQSCEAAAPVALKALAADGNNTRLEACQLLGKVGTAEHLPKVQIVAEKDGHMIEKKKKVIYPVRDACSGAAAKIEVRM